MQSIKIAGADQAGNSLPLPPGTPCLAASARRRAARWREIERDQRLVTSALISALRQIVRNTAAPQVDPETLWRILQDTLAASRETFRRLNSERINLRAQRSAQFDDSMPLPEALACYRHRGNYRGTFRSMAALGALLSRSRGSLDDTQRPQDAASLAEALHLRGELWTFEITDHIHVFTTPASPSDLALAQLRPSLTPSHPATHDDSPRPTP